MIFGAEDTLARLDTQAEHFLELDRNLDHVTVQTLDGYGHREFGIMMPDDTLQNMVVSILVGEPVKSDPEWLKLKNSNYALGKSTLSIPDGFLH